MRGIAVNAVGTARCNDTNFGHALPCIQLRFVTLDVLDRMANLHGAGVGAQQMTAFDIEGVVHRACWMIFGCIEGREVEPVGFNFGALRHFKTHGAKNLLDAL